jgi:hypothetical protein
LIFETGTGCIYCLGPEAARTANPVQTTAFFRVKKEVRRDAVDGGNLLVYMEEVYKERVSRWPPPIISLQRDNGGFLRISSPIFSGFENLIIFNRVVRRDWMSS